jgi:arylsulfatase A-like enzyme
MKPLVMHLEQWGYGALWGVLIGTLAGATEYLLLFSGTAYTGNLVRAYWDIILPYAIAGCMAGVLVALGIRLVWGKPPTFGQYLARLCASLLAVVVLAYLAVWATYWLGVPLLKFSNIMAYLGICVVVMVLGWLLFRVFSAMWRWVESKGHAGGGLRVGLPCILVGLLAAVLLFPPMYLGKSRAAPPAVSAVPADGGLAPRPNIVFILIDTLRADHLSMYGYSRQTAPNLTALARQGTVFTRMYASASATRPSVATIFSSLYPVVHKTNYVRDFMSDSIVTLAEVLRDAGYETLGVSSNPNISPTFGYAQGFGEFRVSRTESPFRFTRMGNVITNILTYEQFSSVFGERQEMVPRAKTITDVTLGWAAQHGQKPSFLYVHYIDPHAPYSPPPPYHQAFDYRSNPPRRAGDLDPLQHLPAGKEREKVSRILDLYDGEILYTDQEVGRLLKGLEELGMLKNALVVITADHGEEFFEHGDIGHSRTLYEEVLRVPFLLSWPGQLPAGGTYEEMAGLVDVMPTLLGLLGIAPPTGLQGLSFATQLTQHMDARPERKFFAQIINDGVASEMVRHQRYKLIRNNRGQQSDPEEFYDLQQDPLERTNLTSQAQSQVAAWRQELDLFNRFASQAAHLIPEGQAGKLDKDTEKALRSLGYIK